MVITEWNEEPRGPRPEVVHPSIHPFIHPPVVSFFHSLIQQIFMGTYMQVQYQIHWKIWDSSRQILLLAYQALLLVQ